MWKSGFEEVEESVGEGVDQVNVWFVFCFLFVSVLLRRSLPVRRSFPCLLSGR